MIGITRRLERGALSDPSIFVSKYDELLKTRAFNITTQTGTSDVANVKKRIDLATKMFESLP